MLEMRMLFASQASYGVVDVHLHLGIQSKTKRPYMYHTCVCCKGCQQIDSNHFCEAALRPTFASVWSWNTPASFCMAMPFITCHTSVNNASTKYQVMLDECAHTCLMYTTQDFMYNVRPSETRSQHVPNVETFAKHILTTFAKCCSSDSDTRHILLA
jgi:hypothetical protein